jgi:hypothetical protein
MAGAVVGVMGVVHRRWCDLHHVDLDHYGQGRRRLACCLSGWHIGIGKAAKGKGDNEGEGGGGLEAAVTDEEGLGHERDSSLMNEKRGARISRAPTVVTRQAFQRQAQAQQAQACIASGPPCRSAQACDL